MQYSYCLSHIHVNLYAVLPLSFTYPQESSCSTPTARQYPHESICNAPTDLQISTVQESTSCTFTVLSFRYPKESICSIPTVLRKSSGVHSICSTPLGVYMQYSHHPSYIPRSLHMQPFTVLQIYPGVPHGALRQSFRYPQDTHAVLPLFFRYPRIHMQYTHYASGLA